MKNTGLALLLMLLAVTSVNAQIGFESGLNMTNLKFKQTSYPIRTTSRKATALGMNIELKLEPHLYFQTGFFLEGSGCKFTTKPTGEYFFIGVRTPLNLVYKTGEKCGNRFFFGLGPYLTRYIFAEHDEISPVITFTPGIELRPLDFGFGVMTGVNLKKHIYFRAHYQFGATVINPSGDGLMKPSAIGLTIGYLFGKCSHNSAKDIFYRPKDDHWRGLRFGAFWYRLRPPRYAR